jgi:23S rRNA (cytosine1962-C5)-methyltransferase
MLKVYLKNGREKPVRMGHPWIFDGAVSKIDGKASDGELCSIYTSQNEFVATGYYNSKSAIIVRVLSYENTPFSSSELNRRIVRAISLRQRVLLNGTDSCRLINSEGDFLPGLIVDKFAAGLVIQILTTGMERFRTDILESLQANCNPEFIYERSDTDARKREGLPSQQGLLSGKAPLRTVFSEQGIQFVADIVNGQKTGFFFDQRQNRELLRSYAAGRKMCDCFSYSGGFSVYGLSGGVQHVDSVDISAPALNWAAENVSQNQFDLNKVQFITADVFKYLRETDRKYDLIVLDPPKFAKHPGEVERAARGYKDINLQAFKKIEAGGLVFTFSCSNAIDSRLFRQIVFAAAADAQRPIQVLHTLSAGSDHPVNIAHKEGEYLKGLVLQIME